MVDYGLVHTWTKIASLLSLLTLVAFGLAGSATAATPRVYSIYWTPAQAQKALTDHEKTMFVSPRAYGNSTVMWDGLAAAPLDDPETSYPVTAWWASAASCRGIGTLDRLKRFAAFRCDVQFSGFQDEIGSTYRGGMWVRPYPGWRVDSSVFTPPAVLICASTRTIADCPPPAPARPLPGDPRVRRCGNSCGPAEVTGNMADVAQDAVRMRLGGQAEFVANLGCMATSTFVYRCSWLASAERFATVRFVPGMTRWTTTVTFG